MLTHLSIRDFTLIEQLDIELDHGMTVISGETGAGKSIMLDALGLALGDRSDSDMVRHGSERAEICASFDLSQLPHARAWLETQQLDQGDDCILRRVVGRNGRSRAYINGQPSPLGNLRALGERLIEIHGQHEHQKLLKKEHHRLLLDGFGGLEPLASEVAQQFKSWQQLQQQLEQLRNRSDEQNAREQLLRYQVQELDQLAPEPDELLALEQEQQQLAQADNLLLNGEAVRQQLSESDNGNCVSLLNHSLQQLAELNLSNDSLDSVNEMINNALIQVEEASRELGHYLDRVEQDPQRLQQVEERLGLFFQIARKHRVEADQLPALHQQLADELSSLSLGDEALEQLEARCQQEQDSYQKLATKLSKQRLKTAKQLRDQVNEQLKQLGMPNSRFNPELTPIEPKAQGIDEIEFLISTNPGQPAKALSRVASGGELSRISLAIQVVTAQTSDTPVLAFDEVDVGIGGAIAEVVGRLLRELGQRCQVLCVTHQPQVASQGHHHLQVSKQTSRGSNKTRIRQLDSDDRIQEIARMLGGIDITQRSIDHAEEMLALH
ncbi:DNA repair protein RecN [Motiliproteus coralliicola]|uniref:DNA repair protein RecN n=1 Tax=Motiliproteus coralliicola TaxID=2283196 RepID=A0A369WEY4_9GAMM|nr:DNA repair protein RecN [Motiliproteus coralliicola]RDE19176.1 DNA repair protein RecN [Motiliproteus coralliicola]